LIWQQGGVQFGPGARPILVQGSLGNPNHLGTFLGITAAFVPLWGLPLWALGFFLGSHTLGGFLGGCLAVLLAQRKRRRWYLLLVPLAVALYLVGTSHGGPYLGLSSLPSRWQATRLAMQGFAYAPIRGHGPGSWETLGPGLQQASGINFGGVLREVHDDLAQFAFQSGGIGLFLLGWWLWRWRRAFLAEQYGAAAAAVGFVSLISFPFHFPAVGVPAAFIAGMALGQEDSHGRE
jgi:hypothetical protein